MLFSVLGVFAIGLCQAQTVFINELHYDNAGADIDELIEVAGPAGTDLTDWTIALYNGTNGEVYRTIALSGTIADQQAGFGTLAFLESGIQNGAPDGLALVDANNNLIQFLSYEGSFTATNGPATGLSSQDMGVEETTATLVGESLQLVGSGIIYTDFIWNEPGPASGGSINPGQDFSVVGNPPDITCPMDIEVGTDEGLCEAVVSFDPATAFDIEDGTIAVTQTNGPTSGSSFPLGDTLIVFSATDSDNNTVFCQFTISVVDLQGPELSCPTDQFEMAGPDGLFEVPDYWALGMVTALDNCSTQTANNSQDPMPGNLIAVGMHEVQLTTADEYGNVSNCSFKLSVDPSLGIADSELVESVLLYPNPVKDHLTVYNPFGNTGIYDMIGQMIAKLEPSRSGTRQSLDLSALAPGIYFVQFAIGKALHTKKLIKQ